MALIDCPDCGRRVSDKAPACPACARPIAGEVLLVATGEGGGSSRPRELSRVRPNRPRHVVAVPHPAEPAAPAAAIAPERRPVPSHVVVCAGCGEEEVLAYRTSRSRDYLCVACEERALVTSARRRSVLQWWPVALIVLLLGCAAAGTSWAIKQSAAPRDPVSN
jgi:hypothetical protein